MSRSISSPAGKPARVSSRVQKHTTTGVRSNPAPATPARNKAVRQDDLTTGKGFVILLYVMLVIGFLAIAAVAYVAFTPSIPIQP